MCHENLGIIDLVEAANTNDRLRLLNDPSALDGNLDNAIHPIFYHTNFLEKNLHLKQALQLASLFLTYDTVLEFFIPLTYGRTLTDPKTGKAFLTNPVTYKSKAELKPYFDGVRKALHCLEHCVIFRWVPVKKRLWGRARVFERKPAHSSDCFAGFTYEKSVIIEMNESLKDFYDDEALGYRTSSRCDKFRHDWQIAVTLVHELIHAYGIMRRGHLKEPHIRLDHPDTKEWGKAWENFMFGSLVNPQDRSRPGTHWMLRRTWADQKQAERCGGKEYSAVGVAWIAKWFRKETWDIVEKEGPLAIAPSVVHLKFVSSSKYYRWIMMVDVPETRGDVERIHDEACRQRSKDKALCQPSSARNLEVGRTLWTLVEPELLQVSNVPTPTRIPPKLKSAAVTGRYLPDKVFVGTYQESDSGTSETSSVSSSEESSTSTASSLSSTSHAKRPRDDDSSRPTRSKKAIKR